MSCSESVSHVFDSLAHRCLHLDFVEFLNKKVSVFGIHNCFYRRAENLYAIFLKDALLI